MKLVNFIIKRSNVRHTAQAALMSMMILFFTSQTAGAQPAGADHFENASLLTGLSGQISASNRNATKEPGEPDHAGKAGGKSLWWTWTAPRDDYFFFDTEGSSFDTLLAVYTGSELDMLTELASNFQDHIPVRGYLFKEGYVIFQAREGVQYHIAVDGWRGEGGDITLKWRVANRPANDDFENAALLTGSSAQVTGSNADATGESGEPNHTEELLPKSVWWMWTAPHTGYFSFDTHGSLFDTLLTIYTGSSVDQLTELLRNNDDGSDYYASGLTFQAQENTRYYIAVDGYTSGHIVLNWRIAARPANDDFENALPLTGVSGQTTGSNTDATKEPGEPDHAGQIGGKSLWWTWTAPQNGKYSFDAFYSSFSPLLAVYTGSDPEHLTEVAEDGSRLTFQAQAGVRYHIALDGRDSYGDAVLDWEILLPPLNDNFDDALPLSGTSGYTSGTNADATSEAGEPNHLGISGGKSVWWTWTAPESAIFSFDTEGSPFAPILAIYTGSSVDNLTEVVSDRLNITMPFRATAGVQYHIAADGCEGGTGDITLNWTIIGPRENDDFSNAAPLTGLSGQVTALNVNATRENGEPHHAGIQGIRSLWWTWTAPESGTVSFNTHGSDFDTTLAVYTGEHLDSLTEIASNDDDHEKSTNSGVSFQADAGVQYHIAVDGVWLHAGDIILNRMFIAANMETYRFERMWPSLQQPWYFSFPNGLATDDSGFVYVADEGNHRIQKLTGDGQFIGSWGRRGSGDGEFESPADIVSDARGFVYVADLENHRIQKFDANGRFVSKWGKKGSGDGEFDTPSGLATDHLGFIYVADQGNHRIQKFTTDGEFVSKWGSSGSEDGAFSSPAGLAVDKSGFVYVADQGNGRIQKFTTDGQFIAKWGSEASGDGVDAPSDMAVGSDGFLYVADQNRIRKFDTHGQFINEWKIPIFGMMYSDMLQDIAVDKNGFVYVTSYYNQSVHKFTTDGQPISHWGCRGNNDGEFFIPDKITTDTNGFVYVTDLNNFSTRQFAEDGQFANNWILSNDIASGHDGFVYFLSDSSVRKLTSDGQIVSGWGRCGQRDGELDNASSIAADKNGYVYVAEKASCRIQKFTSDGEFVTKWGGFGRGPGKFYQPGSIAVDNRGYVYVADTYLCFIQKFTDEGEFVSKWGSPGFEDGTFYPEGSISIDTDDSGSVYVRDFNTHRIQKFSTDGKLIAKIGEFGSGAGNLNGPRDVCLNADGRVYVTEKGNSRVQVFRKTDLTEGVTKAIIVAGGGDITSNSLWDQTRMAANFAYRTLTHQGLGKETICYLSSDTDLDLDGNGEFDDVDGIPTNENLRHAITEWAIETPRADSLIVYLTDHGDIDAFTLSNTESLSGSDLDTWLDSLQETLPGEVIVVYDACYSGSFLSSLVPPAAKKRIVITSTGPDEEAHFFSQNSISFSNYFWTHIFNGHSIGDAFDLAADAMLDENFSHPQRPLLDDNGDGIYDASRDGSLAENTYIGNNTEIRGDAPVIGEVSPDQTISGETTATLYASDVTDNDEIIRVWAVIWPPNLTLGSSGNPVTDLPFVNLMSEGGGSYKADYGGFHIEGTYQIAIYARDRIGNTSVPRVTCVTVENPLRRRGIVILGGSQSDVLWPAMKNIGKVAFEALSFQGYSEDDLWLMSPASIPGVTKMNVQPTLNNLKYAITTWAAENTQDMVLYLAGTGGREIFEMNETEILAADELNIWLNTLQDVIPGRITVIIDACKSGSFIPALAPPAGKERILLASTGSDDPALFLSEGDISFSKFFWTHVLNGTNVEEAYWRTQKAFHWAGDQKPQLNDSQLASEHTIGFGILIAGSEPFISEVSPEVFLSHGELSACIWAKDAALSGETDSVWAVLTPPGHLAGCSVTDLPEIRLDYNSETGRYEGCHPCFSIPGRYEIAVYARDAKGNISLPAVTAVSQDSQEIQSISCDINRDCKVDLADAILALKVAAGIDGEYADSGADADGDGKIGIKEVICILTSIQLSSPNERHLNGP